MTVETKNAPSQSCNSAEGKDRNPSKGTIMNDDTSVPSTTDIERELFKGHAERYAALVWNQGNDLEFLDAVLADMTTEDGRVSERHLRHVFRFTLMRLADELRLAFPTRPDFPEATA